MSEKMLTSGANEEDWQIIMKSRELAEEAKDVARIIRQALYDAYKSGELDTVNKD